MKKTVAGMIIGICAMVTNARALEETNTAPQVEKLKAEIAELESKIEKQAMEITALKKQLAEESKKRKQLELLCRKRGVLPGEENKDTFYSSISSLMNSVPPGLLPKRGNELSSSHIEIAETWFRTHAVGKELELQGKCTGNISRAVKTGGGPLAYISIQLDIPPRRYRGLTYRHHVIWVKFSPGYIADKLTRVQAGKSIRVRGIIESVSLGAGDLRELPSIDIRLKNCSLVTGR